MACKNGPGMETAWSWGRPPTVSETAGGRFRRTAQGSQPVGRNRRRVAAGPTAEIEIDIGRGLAAGLEQASAGQAWALESAAWQAHRRRV